MLQQYLPYVIQYAHDPHPGVRQAAVYGLGVFAECGGTLFAPFVKECLQKLIEVIQHPQSRNGEHATATDNAISSVAKFMKFQCNSVSVAELLPQWIMWLPAIDDPIECIVVHGQLCDFIESNNELVFGKNCERLPKVMSIFAAVVGTDYVDENVQGRIQTIFSKMQALFPPEALQKAFATLSTDDQAILHDFMQSR